MISQKPIVVGFTWFAVVLALTLVYPQFGEMAAEQVPFSFLILAPFGLNSFPQWVIGIGVSYWAIRALGWSEPPTRQTAKYVGIGVVFVLVLHVAWVLFVVTQGGL
jgi:hypothetical protein